MRAIVVLSALFTSLPAFAQVVVIDPGHGGSDPGAVGCGLEEEDAVLEVALRTADLLRADGYTVHLTRSDDRFVGLSARAAFANDRGASRFISIHANANAGTPATGTETFVHTSAGSTSRSLGGAVQEEMIAAWGLRDRGLKTANFAVLRQTSMPASLSEMGFINNCGIDAPLLGNSARLQEMAVAHYRGVVRSFGRTPGSPAPTPDPTPDPDPGPAPGAGELLGVVFEDMGAGLEDTSRRVTGAVVSVRGGPSTTTNGDGFWSFELADGTYTVDVTMTGFGDSSRTCTVAGGQTWCSVGVNRAATRVTVRGVVFEDIGAGFADTSRRISGASVRVRESGATLTTDGGGNWSTELEPGTYTLDVTASELEPASRSCEVAGSGEVWCSVGLTRAARSGTLQGVVFEGDRLSVRIEGANVRVVENGASAVSRSGDGYWALTLPPGTYTVEASGDGFESGQRRCNVVADAATWCSVSIRPLGSGGGALRTIVVEGDEASAEPIEPYTPADAGLTNSCSAGGNAAGGAVMFLFLIGMLRMRARSGRRVPTALDANTKYLKSVGGPAEFNSVGGGFRKTSRKDRRSVLFAGALTMMAACADEPVEESVEPVVLEDAVRLADLTEAFASLSDERVLVEGQFADVTLSPNGESVALSHPGYERLSVIGALGGEARVVATGERSGFEPVWRADGAALGVRVPGQTSTAVPIRAVDLHGETTAPVDLPQRARVRVADDGSIMLRRDGNEERIAPPGDRYFAPRISAKERWVVFQGLSTGLYLYETRRGETYHLGMGSHARFDGDRMVFERLEDDGHEVTAGDLFLADLSADTPRVAPLLVSDAIERSPSISGNRVAFIRGDQVVVADLN